MGGRRRIWQNLRESGRVWEHLGERENLGEPGRIWEDLGEPGRVCESVFTTRATRAQQRGHELGKSWERAGGELGKSWGASGESGRAKLSILAEEYTKNGKPVVA